jgi:hypothetical protein
MNFLYKNKTRKKKLINKKKRRFLFVFVFVFYYSFKNFYNFINGIFVIEMDIDTIGSLENIDNYAIV